MTELHQITLEGTVDITVIETLYGEFEKVLSNNSPVAIDAGQVDRIDTAALQLIYTFREQIYDKGFELQWGALSENFLEISSLIGLTELLKLDSASDLQIQKDE